MRGKATPPPEIILSGLKNVYAFSVNESRNGLNGEDGFILKVLGCFFRDKLFYIMVCARKSRFGNEH